MLMRIFINTIFPTRDVKNISRKYTTIIGFMILTNVAVKRPQGQQMKTPESIRHLRIAIILVFSVLILGTAGYMLIEQLAFPDALYTTIDMMATVGNVVHPLSVPGRMFTIAVIVLGVGSLLYTFGVG